MISEKFEDIISKKPTQLSQAQLLELQAYCSSRSFTLEQWIDVSITLFKSNPDHCYQLLCFLDKHQLSKSAYNDYVHQVSKITIYNNLTGLVLAKATRQSSKEQSQKYINEAKKFLNSSEKVRMTVDKSIILNRAFLHYYGGQITKAINFIGRTYEEIIKTGEGKHLLVTTTLMLAQINFIKKNYQKSLELYKKCLQVNKTLPTKARLGMAYSFYYLGKYEMARACFQRILKLDANCVEAYLGIAVVEDKAQNQQGYFSALASAYKINKEHPLTLLHLAEHFLFRNQLQKAYDLCQTGLISLQKYPKFHKIEQNCRNDYEQLKARFNNILGQINHINSNFADAIKYYTLASGKGLFFNEISLAQSYLNPSSQNYIEAMRLLDEVCKQFQGKDARIISDSYRLMGYLKSKIPPKNKDDKGAQYYYGQALKFNRKDFESKIQYANLLVETSKIKALKQLEQAEKIQLSTQGYAKPQLENNIAVLQLQNGQPQLCEKRLQKCIISVENIKRETEEDQIRKNSLRIITRFNYALSLERQTKWQSAKQIYLEILAINKYHLDAHIRLAYTQFQLGNIKRVKEIFEEGEKLCLQNKYRILRPQKLLVAKAYLEHLSGSSHAAKQTLKQLGKAKDLYVQIFELCINYENIIRKGVELPVLKQFLRPNRQFCYKYCNQDHHATFGYMLLAIILLVDKKVTKSQGIQFFNNLKQFSSDQIPSILYNMALFLSNYDDYESSNSVLALFKEKVGVSIQADQLISLNYLFQSNFARSQAYAKKNIMRDPANLKHRMQLAYVIGRKCLKYYEEPVKDIKTVKAYSHMLKQIEKLQFSFLKVNFFDHLKGISVPQLKERTRNLYLKIKAAAQERRLYMKSYYESFDKIAEEIETRQKEKEQTQKKNKILLQAQKTAKLLEKLLEDGGAAAAAAQKAQNSEDQQQKERLLKEKKKQRALEIAKKRQMQMELAWNELKQKEKEFDQVKKSRKRNTSSKPTQRSRKQRPKEESESPMRSLPEEQSQISAELSQSEPEPEPEVRKKHKHEKKEKKRKRERERQRQRERERGDSSENEASEDDEQKPEKKREADDDDDDLLKNYMA